MAVGLSEYGSSAWLDILFGNAAPVEGYYLALLTGNPSPGFDGDLLATVEVTGEGYARQLVSAWTLAEGGMVRNAEEIDFGLPGEDWGTVTGYALCTSAAGGDLYAFGEFSTVWQVMTGQRLVVVPLAISVTLRAVEEVYE